MSRATPGGFASAAPEAWDGIGFETAAGRTRAERLLAAFGTIRAGEARSVLLFAAYAQLLLIGYYVLKTVREPLLLAAGSAASKSYACAAVAAVLFLGLPLYGALFRRTDRCRLVRLITLFFICNLLVFSGLGRAGLDLGFVYYVWTGVFGVAMLAQFWAHAVHAFNVESGQRLFPLIMAGAAIGAIVGPWLGGALFPLLGPWNLMLLASALLAATLPLVGITHRAVRPASRHAGLGGAATPPTHALGGFSLVLTNRYLLLLALLAVLLNCVNTTGEYLLTDFVIREADRRAAAQPGLDKAVFIAAFYGNYYFSVNALGMLLQLFLVARLFRWIGVHRATVILPLVALAGYGLLVFIPAFAVVRAVKLLENSIDYSIMNTARQALFLPLSVRQQYEGKTAVDTFCWRLGDLLQAGLIYGGLHWLGFGFRQFAALNVILAGLWLAASLQVAKRYPGAASASVRHGQPVQRGHRVQRGNGRKSLPPGDRLGAARRRSAAFASGTLGAAVIVLALPPRATARAATWTQATAKPATLTQATPTQATLTQATPTQATARPAKPAQPAAPPAADAHEAATNGAALFATDAPLDLQLVFDSRQLCRHGARRPCEDAPAALEIRDASGLARRLDVQLRVRGLWRTEAGNCALPPLFVIFPADTAGTAFAGQKLLPLSVHCRDTEEYEQYVLKEYVAYRVYNLLTDASLRVRLARITYTDTSRRHAHSVARYAFFTEHFESLAARRHAAVRTDGDFDPSTADAGELATLELFEYLIGNTDWSVIKGHNVVDIVSEGGRVTAVPYDFDFSGLVDAAYAGPPPQLPIHSVTERLFRGFCHPAFDWRPLFARFRVRRAAISALVEQVPGLAEGSRRALRAYLDAFFAALAPAKAADVVRGCRPGPNPGPRAGAGAGANP